MVTKPRELGQTKLETIWIIINTIHLKKQANVTKIFRTSKLSYETILHVVNNLKKKEFVLSLPINKKIIDYSLTKKGEELLTTLSKLLGD